MRFVVLALDYDGTIAVNGVLDPEVRRAIVEARAGGIVVVLVTGRILNDLRDLIGDLRLVDAVVAENGAVIAFPATGRTTHLAPPAPPALVEALRAADVNIDVGVSVIEADATAAPIALAAIRTLEVPQVLVFNRSRMMLLPLGVNKATGLREVMRTLRLSTHNAVAIGDAENDHDLLEACELGIAVAWGSPALKAAADQVLEGTGPPAVAAAIRELVAEPRIAPTRVGRRVVTLGLDRGNRPVSLAVRGRNVLVVGDPKSGKSWVAGLLCEQHILHRYGTCVIDPEGDYIGLEMLPGVVVIGGAPNGPTPRELRTALRYPDVNLVLNLSRMAHAQKLSYIHALLPMLAEHRRRTGTPHRIVLDEAHYFLHDPDVHRVLDLELAGYTLVTYQPSRLHPDVLVGAEAIVATRVTDGRELDMLAASRGWSQSCREAIAALELGQAALIATETTSCGFIAPITLAQRLTPHVRHRDKYLDVPVAVERSFVFNAAEHSTVRASTLREFVEALASQPTSQVNGHLTRGDFSRWFREVFGDPALASAVQEIEEQFRLRRVVDAADAVIHAVSSRYQFAAEFAAGVKANGPSKARRLAANSQPIQP